MRNIGRIGVVVVVVAIALAFASSPALAKGGKGGKNKGAKAVAGKITAVDASSLTIDNKKQGSKKFKLAPTTVYQRASDDPAKPATPATLADVKVGRRARVTASADQAQKVTLAAHKAKGGGKAKGQGKQGKKRK